MTSKILIVDDEPEFQRLCGDWLASQGHTVSLAGDLAQMHSRLAEQTYDVLLLDLALPPAFDPQTTLDVIPELNTVAVIVMTGHAQRELAIQAIHAGAWDFLAKPVDPDLLAVVVQRAAERQTLLAQVQQLQALAQAKAAQQDDMGLIGRSQAMEAVRALIRRLAPANIPILISGASGTGKELAARAVHAHSNRAGALVPVHCGAIPAELFESEMFGHLKGSFSGADRDKTGLIKAADGGTLFLDEIGEMPLPMQVKLLRVLQDGHFYPVGSHEQQHADIRVLAATNVDLQAAVAAGEFREDLFYRLRGMALELPRLNQRLDDIAILAKHILASSAAQQATATATLPPASLQWLLAHNWPGNVRQLKQVLETAAALALNPAQIAVDDLQLAAGELAAADEGQLTGLDAQLQALEKRLLLGALEACDHNHSATARLLEISRGGLLKKMSKYGLR